MEKKFLIKQYPEFVKTYKLNNGQYIPAIGLGTYQISHKNDIEVPIKAAYDAGYRHLDSAVMYANEKLIGDAIKNLNIDRDEFFITTKIPPESMTYDKTIKLVNKSLLNFNTKYIDLVLIHWPEVKKIEKRIDVWKALEKCVFDGKVISIGVSNFLPIHLETIFKYCVIKPVVNQIEIHPLYIDFETIEYCKNNNIVLEAYCPFAQYDDKLIKNKVLNQICKKYNKSPSQVLVKWSLQHNFVVLPKSSNKDRIFQNIDINDFQLTEEDMNLIDSLNCGYKIDWDSKCVKF